MPHRRALLLAMLCSALLFLVSCLSSQSPGEMLTGSWGNDHDRIMVVADTQHVEFLFPCYDIRVDGPVRLDADLSFAVAGTVQGASGLGVTLHRGDQVPIKGWMVGSTLELGPPSATLVLRRGEGHQPVCNDIGLPPLS